MLHKTRYKAVTQKKCQVHDGKSEKTFGTCLATTRVEMRDQIQHLFDKIKASLKRWSQSVAPWLQQTSRKWHQLESSERFQKIQSQWNTKIAAPTKRIALNGWSKLDSRFKFKDKFLRLFPKEYLDSMPKKFEFLTILTWIMSGFTIWLASLKSAKTKSTRTSIAVTAAICCFFIADLLTLFLESYLPEPPSVKLTRTTEANKRARSLEEYNSIFVRNLFNSQGIIPGEESSPTGDPNATPTRTNLPINLVGTLIMKNELRSIATLEDKGANQVYPLRIQDEVPGKLKVLSIDAYRVTFLNISSNRREFVELPSDGAPLTTHLTVMPGAKGAGIEQVSPNNFNIQRSKIDKAFQDINQIITQARAVPHTENGRLVGYRLFQIVPGSIYSELGILEEDIICGVDGAAIDPGQAFQKLSELKTAKHLELCLIRGGKTMSYSYDIN